MKEISEESLVIAVTHKREYAEKYGDRIIEMSEGKAIKDSKAEYRAEDEADEKKSEKTGIPIKTAIKIGCANFKYHSFKISMIILLCVIALSSFSFFLTLSFMRPDGADETKTDLLKYMFLFCSIVFLVISVFTTAYYFSQEIVDKRNTICIVSSLGCSRINICKIFLSEIVFTVLITLAVTCIVNFLLTVTLFNIAAFIIFLKMFAVLVAAEICFSLFTGGLSLLKVLNSKITLNGD